GGRAEPGITSRDRVALQAQPGPAGFPRFQLEQLAARGPAKQQSTQPPQPPGVVIIDVRCLIELPAQQPILARAAKEVNLSRSAARAGDAGQPRLTAPRRADVFQLRFRAGTAVSMRG